MQDWLDSMRGRKTPLLDLEIGHRTIGVYRIANMTRLLNRKLQWDPQAERIAGDAEAGDLLTRPRRKGYELPEVA